MEALRSAGVELLVDVRAVASSRLPGFSKTPLAAELEAVGIDYLHLRDLGTPADGRIAVRAGRIAEMREIYARQLTTLEAREDLDHLVDIVRSGRRACLLCFEADPTNCHRTLVAAAVSGIMPVKVTHLSPTQGE